MWDCPKCGCQSILGLPSCPQCGTSRPKTDVLAASVLPAPVKRDSAKEQVGTESEPKAPDAEEEPEDVVNAIDTQLPKRGNGKV